MFISPFWANVPSLSGIKEHTSFEYINLSNGCNLPFAQKASSFPNYRKILSDKIINPIMPHLQFFYYISSVP